MKKSTKSTVKPLPKPFTFQVYQSRNKQYALRAIASNGQIVATFGESYKLKAHAIKMARKLGAMELVELLRNDIALMIERIKKCTTDRIDNVAILGNMLAVIDQAGHKIEVDAARQQTQKVVK